MTTPAVKTLSELISTAVATYGNLSQGNLETNLQGKSPWFTSIQAEKFSTKYTFIHQQENISLNGFSAAVFRDNDTQKHVIAMRGTDEFLNDGVITDVASIGVNGFANTQAVEMYRY